MNLKHKPYDSHTASQRRWDEYFLGMAIYVSLKSKDESTKCGCIIVGPEHEVRAQGYNGLPRFVDDRVPERHQRPEKYKWFEHAERNSVYAAALHGVALKGCTAYVTGPLCADCARALIQAGIVRVVIPSNHNMINRAPALSATSPWTDSIEAASQMLCEAAVDYEEVEFDAQAMAQRFLAHVQEVYVPREAPNA